MRFNFSIAHKVVLILSFNLLLLIGIFIQDYLIYVKQRTDVSIINMAGRERMFTQKMTKATLAYLISRTGVVKKRNDTILQEDDARYEAESASNLFNLTLNVLMYGGHPPLADWGSGEGRYIPPPSDPTIKKQLKRVKNAWNPFKKNLSNLLNAEDIDSDSFITSRKYILENNLKLLEEVEKAVKMFEIKANKRLLRTESLQVFFLFLGSIMFFLTLLLVKKTVTDPLNDMTKIADEISLGVLDHDIKINTNDEMGALGRSFIKMIKSQREKAFIAESIAGGDFDIDVTIASKDDVLGKAMNEMVKKLKEKSNALQALDLIKTGLVRLNERTSGELDTATLCENILSFIADFLSVQAGVIYVVSGKDTLRSMGSYAFGKKHIKDIHFGDGLVGQVAVEKRSLFIPELSADNLVTIDNTLCRLTPKSMIFIPIIYEEKVIGVLELYKLDSFTPIQIDFLNQSVEKIGVALNSAEYRHKMKELLNERKLQSEELRAQQEKLRVSNEYLRLMNEELESSNSKLTNAREEMENKARELELSNKYKTDFFANMSHELRTPLNSLLLLASMLAENEEGNLSKEQVDSLNIIHSSGEDLLGLINEILDLSKVESGKIDLYFRKLDILKCAKGIENTFRCVAQRKKLGFSVNVSESLPTFLLTDEKRLKQIIKNLLFNAFKFTDKGSVTLSISYSDENMANMLSLGPNEVIAFKVSDTGIGISDDKKTMIFDPFLQGDTNINRKYGGTGLGLSISKELASLLGGVILLESSLGSGSTFTLLLPLKTIELPGMQTVKRSNTLPPLESTNSSLSIGAPPTIKNLSAELPGDFTPLKGKKILLLEHDMRDAYPLSQFLQKKSMRVIIAESIEKIPAFLANNGGVDLVLIGSIDAYAAVEKIQEYSQHSTLPVLIISEKEGIINNSKLSKCVVNYIHRQFSGVELLSSINESIKLLQRA